MPMTLNRLAQESEVARNHHSRRLRALRRVLLACSLAASTALVPMAVHAQAVEYQPEVGQEGKDVVWVPTPQALVERMLDIAKVTPKDYLIDLGSGDGRTVITAAQRGLTAHGIEYNPEMAELARRNIASAGVAERATIATGDLFEADLSRADVITMFLLPSINERLRPVLLDLKPGTRVVSNSFRMGDWEPDETAGITEQCQNWCTALLWIVPAKVGGTWQLNGQNLTLSQQLQRVTGTLGNTPISDGRLNGSELSFTAEGVRYTGTVDGNRITGTGGGAGAWTANRV